MASKPIWPLVTRLLGLGPVGIAPARRSRCPHPGSGTTEARPPANGVTPRVPHGGWGVFAPFTEFRPGFSERYRLLTQGRSGYEAAALPRRLPYRSTKQAHSKIAFAVAQAQ
jgi:hypothetical protein